jgi:hypothetical protein
VAIETEKKMQENRGELGWKAGVPSVKPRQPLKPYWRNQ